VHRPRTQHVHDFAERLYRTSLEQEKGVRFPVSSTHFAHRGVRFMHKLPNERLHRWRGCVLTVLASLAVAPFAPAQQEPWEVGAWSGMTSCPRVAVHTVLLPTGKVHISPYNDDARLWDPVTNQVTTPARAGYNTFCNGHSLLADGRLFIAGGHIENGVGLPN